ncbi:hypothetical protein AURDEDRAFT_155757 [Auricularia subglabra TFB-10046 SS5]|nr:hypothetical protein AURDEDRAFT_155757 [Auricularia subglabra TFB-10046 SS5]
MYIFGGCEPGTHAPTSHLFRLDLQQDPMSWVDLTHMTRRAAHFSALESIPARTGAAAAFYRHANRALPANLWRNADGAATADLITVDLTSESDPTWDVQVSVSNGIPRVEAALVVLSHKLFIFGGHSQPRNQPDTQPPHVAQNSFCVLEFHRTQLQWQWVLEHGKRDHLAPFLGYGLSAAPWYSGILVVQGRKEEDDIDLDEESFHHYDPHWHRWSVLSLEGQLPPPAAWYNLRTSSPDARGALLSVWYETVRNDPESDKPLIACDIWAFEMGQVKDRVKCLDLATPIWQKKSADFDLFQLLPNGRMLMFGARNGDNKNKTNKNRSKRNKHKPTGGRWDVCVDLTEAVAVQLNGRAAGL